IKLGHGPADDVALAGLEDPRERADDPRDRDPRDPFIEGLELPTGLEREIVVDGNDRYELNGDESRSLATIGAFRIVSESDLRDPRDESDAREPDLRHLRDEGLVRFVSLGWTRPRGPADRPWPARAGITPPRPG